MSLNTIRGHFWQFSDLRQMVDSSVKLSTIKQLAQESSVII